MPTSIISGIPVSFPFEPYDIQKDYMEKVMQCLQNGTNGVLESPTGTGKTLSLLCSSLAWLEMRKAQIQAQNQAQRQASAYLEEKNQKSEFLKLLQAQLDDGSKQAKSQSARQLLGMPTIIYASRTHSQLSQAMRELKKSSYNHMAASVLGSREQMCIHPELAKEVNALKVPMCRQKVKSRSCHYFNKVERKKDDPNITGLSVIDIEDLVKLGNTHKFCPYYMSKELKDRADIIFMPYNYLLDPRSRKALGVELAGNVVIFDEAHNIEKICEDSASLQIKSTDVTLAIEEVTAVMKLSEGNVIEDDNFRNVLDPEQLCIVKQMLLDFEKHFDEIEVKNPTEGVTLEGNYIFELLDKAGINDSNQSIVIGLLNGMIEFLALASSGEGPFQRRGNGLQLFADLLLIAFAGTGEEFKKKIERCYRVHVRIEESKQKNANNWLTKLTTKSKNRVLSYWCFSPGFGMNMILDKGIHAIILTSGTLAPLKPLISELEMNISVKLENPHIVTGSQVCVKIVTKGPDSVPLNSNYENRSNPAYLSSLGQSILNLTRLIPDGVLIFFPSYPVMLSCQQHWQEKGIWHSICKLKPIYVEPRDKTSFNTAMTEYYDKINDPTFKGAIFMGVCRGKVSEGLDFADINGRAVFITGLPYPPLKDPRVMLKKRYLDICNAKDKEYLKGNDWYSLEASRAVNQAIGRVIRHRHDYGAIILLDCRFTNPKIMGQMSRWLQGHVKIVKNFGELLMGMKNFFQNAKKQLPQPKGFSTSNTSQVAPLPAEFEIPNMYKKNFDFSSSSSSSSTSCLNSPIKSPLVTVHKRPGDPLQNAIRKKITITTVRNDTPPREPGEELKDFIAMVQKKLGQADFKTFATSLQIYRDDDNLSVLISSFEQLFAKKYSDRHLILGVAEFLRDHHRKEFAEYCRTIVSNIFLCSLCGQSFCNKQNINRHMKNIHKDPTFI